MSSKCIRCHKHPKGICNKTGFRYDWCGPCYTNGVDFKEEYEDEIKYGDHLGNDGKEFVETVKYEEAMKKKKFKWMEAQLMKKKKREENKREGKEIKAALDMLVC
jgi:cytochrome c2